MAETKGLEPVAWRYRWLDEEAWRYQVDEPTAPGVIGEPLYSADAIERLEREKRMLRAAKDDCFNAAKEAQASLSAAQAEIAELKEALGANEVYAITEAQVDEPRREEDEALTTAEASLSAAQAEIGAVVAFALQIEGHSDRIDFLKAMQNGSSETLPCWEVWREFRRAKDLTGGMEKR